MDSSREIVSVRHKTNMWTGMYFVIKAVVLLFLLELFIVQIIHVARLFSGVGDGPEWIFFGFVIWLLYDMIRHFYELLQVKSVFSPGGIKSRIKCYGREQFASIPWEEVKFLFYEKAEGGERIPWKVSSDEGDTIELKAFNDVSGQRAMEIAEKYLPEEKIVDITTRYKRDVKIHEEK